MSDAAGPVWDPPVTEAPAPLPPELDQAIAELYAETGRRIAELGPRCELSGRCCRFKEYGHDLFVSELEFAYLRGHQPEAFSAVTEPPEESCPLQQGALCGVHQHRPLGCRIFYCDPRFEEELAQLYEDGLQRLKQLVSQHGRPWGYRPFLRYF